ncbi:MAG: hypothetical protein Q4B87_00280 [Candidatus Saccharibacteria bacterium]|nr:hypothetical protein [Candidatus Saccharibacteria bacterium]
MAKKIDLEKAAEKVEGISNTVDLIMRNRLIIAVFLIVDGVTFLLNPNTTLSGMAQNIILLALLAALSIFLTNLASKKKDTKTILISLTILIVGGIFYFFPDLIAAYIQLLLSLFIIYDGVKNIANTLHIGWLSNYTQKIAKKYDEIANRKAKDKKKQEKREKFKEVDDNLNNGFDEQMNKLMSPLQGFAQKASKLTILYVIVNVITVILGLILLIFPNVSMSIWGIIFLYTGLTNFFASAKSMEVFKKIREKKFKEIVFGAKKAKKDEEKAKNGEGR